MNLSLETLSDKVLLEYDASIKKITTYTICLDRNDNPQAW